MTAALAAVLALGFLVIQAPLAQAFSIDPAQGPFQPEVFAASPDREQLTVRPGEVTTISIQVQNRLSAPIKVDVKSLDGAGSANPENIIDFVNKAKYGAGRWLELERKSFQLEVGDKATLDVTIRVPHDASPGSHYAGIKAITRGVKGGATGGGAVNLVSTIIIQVFFDVPGEKRYDGEIEDASYPSYVEHGEDKIVPIDIVYHNTGNVTDKVGGQVLVKSIFGTTALELPLKDGFVLRDGKRAYRAVWNDTPWIGIFRPVVTMVGENGKKRTLELEPIVVFPPWYYLLLVLLTLAYPIYRRYRNRNDWREFIDEEGFEEEEVADW